MTHDGCLAPREQPGWRAKRGPSISALVDATHGASVPHAIYVAERSAATFAMTCNGMPREASRDAATGLVEVVCDGELDVTP